MKLHQQGNEIIVTELRAMSDLMSSNDYSRFVLAYKKTKHDFIAVRQSSNDEVYCFGNGKFYNISNFEGWLPMPQYRPDEKHIDKTELYEKLRKLNPRQFSELFETHLKGDASFDELVAKLP